MNLNDWIRKVHRWLSVAFTAAMSARSISAPVASPPACAMR